MRGLPLLFQGEDVCEVEEDFQHGSFATGVALGNGFTPTHAVGAITTGDALHGQATFTYTAAADEYMSWLTTNELFQFLIGRPIRFKGILKPSLAVAVVQELNIFIGCMENMDTATEFQAAGAGMRALCGDIFGFFCVEAGGGILGQYWHCITGHNDLEQVTELSANNAGNLSGQDWKIHDGTNGYHREFVGEWMPTNLVPGIAGAAPTLMDGEARYWIDGQLVCKHLMNGTYRITRATTELMNFGLVGENLTDIVVMDAYYMKCSQLRCKTAIGTAHA